MNEAGGCSSCSRCRWCEMKRTPWCHGAAACSSSNTHQAPHFKVTFSETSPPSSFSLSLGVPHSGHPSHQKQMSEDALQQAPPPRDLIKDGTHLLWACLCVWGVCFHLARGGTNSTMIDADIFYLPRRTPRWLLRMLQKQRLLPQQIHVPSL